MTDIFKKVAGENLLVQIKVDRVHRALGPRSSDPSRPQDVICRLHHYIHKEAIAHRAWESGDLEFDGARVILPDLSRAMLHHRALPKPLLDLARRRNATYRWGFPLSVTFHRGQRSFQLRSPEALPALFAFLEADPIALPNWMGYLPRYQGRPSMQRSTAPRPQRPQRGERCPHTLSQEESPEL